MDSNNDNANDIPAWRNRIDELDRQLVDLLNQRAQAAHEIGRLKQIAHGPVYEPDRERAVLSNVQAANYGPLPPQYLQRIYERIMDVMRRIQLDEVAPQTNSADDRSAAQIEQDGSPGDL